MGLTVNLNFLTFTGSYVEGIVNLFYKTNEAVKEDAELQAWCKEITELGLLGAQDRGKMKYKRLVYGTSPRVPLYAMEPSRRIFNL